MRHTEPQTRAWRASPWRAHVVSVRLPGLQHHRRELRLVDGIRPPLGLWGPEYGIWVTWVGGWMQQGVKGFEVKVGRRTGMAVRALTSQSSLGPTWNGHLARSRGQIARTDRAHPSRSRRSACTWLRPCSRAGCRPASRRCTTEGGVETAWGMGGDGHGLGSGVWVQLGIPSHEPWT